MFNFDELIKNAVESTDFRQRLIANAEAAALEAGLFLPPGSRLVVHQDTANEMNLVIGGQTENVPEEALKLLAKAEQDVEFKVRLVTDPVMTARAEIGVVLPPTVKVCVHENTDAAIHIVLPPLPPTEPAAGELSDMELEAVAGGKSRRPTSVRKTDILIPFPIRKKPHFRN